MARLNTWDQRRLAVAALNPSATFRMHEAIRTESIAGAYTPQRTCKGPCRKRRSLMQFKGDNTMCNQCIRRAPKGKSINENATPRTAVLVVEATGTKAQ